MSERHDHGLAFDLAMLERQLLARRRMLGLMAAGGGALLLEACSGGGSGTSSTSATTAATTTTTNTPATGTGASSCAATPQETQGPYPADGSNNANGVLANILNSSGVLRSDIRSSFGGLSGTAAGVPLTLTINLVNTNAACAALTDYAIYAWHADANGQYSLYDLPQQNYLRGVQTTNASGQATFATTFPGCYAGRYPHVHFEVYRTLGQASSFANRLLTSQFVLPRDVSSAVYATSGYPNSASRLAQITTASDNVFGDNTAAQIAAMTPTLSGSTAAGYSGSVTVGLAA